MGSPKQRRRERSHECSRVLPTYVSCLCKLGRPFPYQRPVVADGLHKAFTLCHIHSVLLYATLTYYICSHCHWPYTDIYCWPFVGLPVPEPVQQYTPRYCVRPSVCPRCVSLSFHNTDHVNLNVIGELLERDVHKLERVSSQGYIGIWDVYE